MTDTISWRNPKVLRILALVFVAGALSGAVSYRIGRMFWRPPPPVVMSLREKEATLVMLKRELHLTDTQSGQVAAIIDDYKRYYGNIQDQIEEVRATGKDRILQILDPEQRTKFQKLAESLK